MELLNTILYGFSVSLAPANLLACFIGVLLGTLVGVLPGLGPPAAIALLLPVTYKMTAVSSIIMLAGIYYGAMYGGSTTSILLNIPGEAASVVTCFDGYQMARRGRAGAALGISAFASLIAGTLGVVGIMLISPALAKVAVKFDAPDYVGLFTLGLTLVAYLASGSKVKAIAMAVVGLFLGTVGLDPIVGAPSRFTFGSVTFLNGIELTPLVMGFFGISEVLLELEKKMENQEVFKTSLKGLFPNRHDWRVSLGPILRGTVGGFLLGVIPGIGAAIPTFISYATEKKISKTPERFGRGAIEGVAGPEAANNAYSEGSLVPLLALGIPPTATMALLLGALMIHGIIPGPLLMQEHPDVFWGVVTSMYTGNAMLILLNLPLIPIWVKVLKVPYYLLYPLIFLFCIIGSYSINNNYIDVLMMGIFGIVGYLIRKFEYEPALLILAFVLGRRLEEAVRQTLIYSDGDFSIFVKRPLALALLTLALIVILSPLFSGILRRKTLKHN